MPADPPPPAADDDAAPDDEPVVGDADGGGGGGSMGKARRWAKNLPDPSCCPALSTAPFAHAAPSPAAAIEAAATEADEEAAHWLVGVPAVAVGVGGRS